MYLQTFFLSKIPIYKHSTNRKQFCRLPHEHHYFENKEMINVTSRINTRESADWHESFVRKIWTFLWSLLSFHLRNLEHVALHSLLTKSTTSRPSDLKPLTSNCFGKIQLRMRLLPKQDDVLPSLTEMAGR